nr:T cell receptor alpha variable 26-2 [Rousettus aegyptiacus]
MRSVAGITILLTLGIMGDAKSTQPDAVASTEEEPVLLPCNHPTISGAESIHWYRQIPGQGPEHMIHGLKGNVSRGMTSLIIATDRKSSTLVLAQVTLRDSAVYYCILREAQ